ncbi:MAG: sigma-70 family RNA polymerase sigma factor [Planctomycetia bacterium]
MQLLTPAEEQAIVKKLCRLRDGLDRDLRPAIADLPEDVRVDHFDQRLAQAVERGALRGAAGRRFRRRLDAYNELKHRLVLANLPWVTKLARTQRQSAVAEEDLFQEGVCGLLKAIDRFEAARGLRLMTYATWYIREAMQQVRARQSYLVSLSSHDQTLLGRIEARRVAFQHEHGRPPAGPELQQTLMVDSRSVVRLQSATYPPVSLERSGVDGVLPIPVDDPALEFDRLEAVQCAVRRLLESLPLREREVVTRRFGLDGGEPSSLEDLGDDLKVSKERIRQLQRQALLRMQQAADASLDVVNV